MLDKNALVQFAQSLLDAWNRHDIVAILDHYSDEIEVTNPLFNMLLGTPDGVLRGKAAIRPLWADVLRQIPHLRFKLHDVYLGVDSFAMHYQGIFERNVIEVLRFDDKGKVASSVNYLMSLDLP